MNKTARMMLIANQTKKPEHDRWMDDERDGYGRMGYESMGRERGYNSRDYDPMAHVYNPYSDYPRRESREDYDRPKRSRRARIDRYEDEDDDDWEMPRKKKKRDWDEDEPQKSYPEHITEGEARDWVMKMQNSDGTHGAHFTPESAEQLRATHCPDCNSWDFFAAVNMIYSDYGQVMKKFGQDRPEIYACLAKSFLCDDDAKPGKLARYMENIPK